VRAAGAGSANGSSYANAYVGWAGINKDVFNPGDTLIVCGVVSSATAMVWDPAGSPGAPITLTGRCPEEAGTLGVLDGQGTATPTLKVRYSYVNVQDMTIRNSGPGGAGDCLMLSSDGGGPGFNILSRLTIRHCGNEGVHSQKPFTTLQDSDLRDIGQNGIEINSLATDFQALRNHVENWATLNVNGDGIECNMNLEGNITIRQNTIVFNNFNSHKQGIICGNSGGGTVLIEENIVTAPIPALTHNGIAMTRGVAIVRQNTVNGFYGGFVAFNDTSSSITSVTVSGNDFGSNYFGVRLAISHGPSTFNIYNNTGVNVSYGLSVQNVSGIPITINHFNNIWSLDATGGYGINIPANVIYKGNANIITPERPGYLINAGCGGSAYSTMAAYKAACAQEISSSSADPLLLPSHGLQASSPAKNAGIATALCRGIEGHACCLPPDIGAYQSSCYPQPPPPPPSGLQTISP
jgi:hypothetical protein